MIDKYYKLSRKKLFILILSVNLILLWVSRTVLINDIVFYNTYSEQLTYERAMELFRKMNEISWITYFLVPLVLFLKLLIVTIVLYIGIFFFNYNRIVSFGNIFRVVIASEIVFTFASFFKFLWFFLFAGNYDLNDLSFFYPLSLINLFKTTEVGRLWIYPLQVLNLFQVFYLLSLSYGLQKFGVKAQSSEKLVLSSYLPALTIWIVLIMFLTIDSGL
jgi:hypothetical protein